MQQDLQALQQALAVQQDGWPGASLELDTRLLSSSTASQQNQEQQEQGQEEEQNLMR